MPLTRTYNKIRKLALFDTAKVIADIINENGAFVSELLKDQFRQGKDGLGNDLTLRRHGGVFPYYSDATIREKERKNQQTEYITYYDSGAFYLSIYTFASGETFILDSDVPYFADILLKAGSGEFIMHLNKENLLRLRNEIIIPQFKAAFEARVKNV